MLANLENLAADALEDGIGLGAFNVIHLEHATALIGAAERSGLPVVLQISENAVKYHKGKLGPLAAATVTAAKASSARVCVHLDHAENVDLVREALDLGFTSIMYDGSKLPDEENRRVTRQVARWCHDRGVSIEAELGEVGGKDGVHAPGVRTNPTDAKKFVEDTGVDLLAVAVGSSHAMTSRTAVLDLELIGKLAEAVPVPLVLHGSSGVSDENMVAAIKAGITKVNVSTHLNKVFTNKVRELLAANPDVVDSRKWQGPAYEEFSKEAQRLLELYASV